MPEALEKFWKIYDDVGEVAKNFVRKAAGEVAWGAAYADDKHATWNTAFVDTWKENGLAYNAFINDNTSGISVKDRATNLLKILAEQTEILK